MQITVEQLNQAEAYLKESFGGKPALVLWLEDQISASQMGGVVAGAISVAEQFPMDTEIWRRFMTHILALGILAGLSMKGTND